MNINIAKLEYSKNNSEYKEKIISFTNIFSILHRKKINNKYAILFPEVKIGNKPNIGNIILIYSDNLEFLKNFNRFFTNNDFIVSYYPNYEVINAEKFGYSYRNNNMKKIMPSYIRNLIKNNFKNIKHEIDIKIQKLYEKYKNNDNVISLISNDLKKIYHNEYPFFIYNSQSLFKKGIHNSTIFQIGTKIFNKNDVDGPKIDLSAFNNFGLIKNSFKKNNIVLPII